VPNPLDPAARLECTGNGTLAAARQGVLADAAVLLEPTDLGLLLGGVGILWAELTVPGLPAHAGARTLARFLAGYYAAGGLRTAGAS
jgi:acetylornithine deacetylase